MAAFSLEELEYAKGQTSDPNVLAKIDRLIQEMPQAPSQTESFGRGALQGVTLDLSDEITGLGGGAYEGIFGDESFGEGYTRHRDEAREANRRAEQENPGSYLSGELGSALVPGFGAFKGLSMVPKAGKYYDKLSTTGKVVGAGAVSGGVGGYGASTAEDAGGMLADTATGAAVGAIAAPVLGKLASVGGNAIGGTASAAYRKLFDDPEDMANRLIREDLEEVGFTNPQDVFDEAAKTGGRLANLSPTLRGDAVIASKVPGPGRQVANDAVREDQAGQSARLTETIHESVQPKWTDFQQFKTAVADQREKQAAPFYKSAYETDFQPSEMLLRMQNVPFVRDALIKAQESMKDAVPSSSSDLGGANLPGNKLELFDLAKREMDDAISRLRVAGSFDKARRMGALKRAWVDELDKLVPDYKKARGIYAGAKEMEDASDLGRYVLSDTKMQAGDLAQITKDYGPGEWDALRIGLVQNMIDIMKNAGPNASKSGRLFATDRHKDVIGHIYPDKKSMGLLEESIEGENTRNLLRNETLGGSATAERLAAKERIDARRGDGVVGSVAEFVRRVYNRDVNPERMSEADYNELAKKLYSKLSIEEITKIMSSKGKFAPTDADIGNVGATIGVGSASFLGEESASFEL